MITIAAVDADWLLDSRATPTIEVTITLTDGSRHRAMAPAGASTGSHESAELRDSGDPRWRGRGVGAAVAAAREIAGPALAGLAPDDQASLDARLIEADGTARRGRLGANAMVAASVAGARAGAAVTGRELWQHLADGRRPLLPVPMVNILSGNLHAAGMRHALRIRCALSMPRSNAGSPAWMTSQSSSTGGPPVTSTFFGVKSPCTSRAGRASVQSAMSAARAAACSGRSAATCR